MRTFSVISLFVSCFAWGGDLACFEGAADRYRVNKYLLLAIAEQESNFNQRATNSANSDQSFDVGIMQINSNNFPALSQYGITENMLKEDQCLNIYVGAFILAQAIQIHGNTWRAVGAYNSGHKKSSEAHRESYARRVYARYLRLSADDGLRN